MLIVKPCANLIDPTYLSGADMLKRIERAGRTAYKSEACITSSSASKFVARLIKMGHESVIEHESLSARIICDRGVSHEIVRHRIASYTQESTRYCDYARLGRIEVIEPPGLTFAVHGQDMREIWYASVSAAEKVYNALRDAGVQPQITRSVLPTYLKTELVMTANLREWRHFFKLRCAKAAHPQMREIACSLLSQFKAFIPVVFDDILTGIEKERAKDA